MPKRHIWLLYNFKNEVIISSFRAVKLYLQVNCTAKRQLLI